MTRGKYAARAANRLAEIDAGIIAELREKLAALTAERDSARAEIERLRRDQASLARHQAEELAKDAVREMADELIAIKAARASDRSRYCDEVFELLHAHDATMARGGWAMLASYFGRGAEVGELMNRTLSRNGNRNARRTSAKRLRHISTLIEQERIPDDADEAS